VYPEDNSIRCSRFIKQWIVEGFVKEDEKGKTLEEMGSSIGKLLNLQTLDLKHTNMKFLPNSIQRLQKLKHLYITGSIIQP